ncbi:MULTISPECIES: N-acetylmuramidase domain-containing protein [Acetobacter]|uniref:N-acetylmuramidase domain-containing protein n=1 Tax=Acetobacter TaxID=434 RepID=UPI00376FE18D
MASVTRKPLFSCPTPRKEEEGGFAFCAEYDAALKATSWGAFQILGENFRCAGYGAVSDFVRAMGDINKQADAFVKFNLSNNKMRRALINKDWVTFASVYNGSTYYRYNYDRRIKANYEKIIMNTFIQNPPAKNDIDAAFLRTAWSQSVDFH